MNIAEAISRAVAQLEQEPVGPPRLAAEALMQYALGCEKAYLYAHPERELTGAETSSFEQAVERRAAGEPLQYITGHQEFWGLDFLVSPAVLIPRPETEHLVEAALEALAALYAENAQSARLRIVDVGTGSGAIILALAHELTKRGREVEFHATDISGEALAVAKENARRLSLTEKVKFHQADLLKPFSAQHESFDLVVSNPPYVGLNEKDKVQREVREHEPQVAVFAGEHGLDIYRRLIPQAHAALKPGGWLLMEIGYSIEAAVCRLLGEWTEIGAVADLQGIPRVLRARKR